MNLCLTALWVKFGPDIIYWVKCLYNDVKSSVTNSGYMAEFFHIKRSLRQGFTLSACLFIIYIKLFAATVRENMYGCIPLIGNGFKSTMFAFCPSTIFQFNRDRSSWVEPVLS